MSNSLPKFDFSKMNLTDDQLNEQLKGDQKKSFFKPGKHEVKIVGIEYKGAVESDATWHKYRILFEGTYNKEISDLMMVPTSNVILNTSKGEQSSYPYRKLKDFMTAVGVELSLTNLGEVLSKAFGEKSNLVGKDLAIECAYDGIHVKFQGKDATGNNKYQLVNKREEPLYDQVFADHKSANEFGKKEGLEVEGFVDIMRYVASSTPNTASTTAKQDW